MRQILFAGAIGLFLSLIGTPLFIRLLVRRGYGQLIRDDGPTSHHSKRGTPTMGGAVFIVATLAAYFVTKLIAGTTPTVSGLLALFLMTGLGVVGFLDDYIKISKQRSLGLRAGPKMIGQTLVAVVFGVLALNFPDERGITPASTRLSFVQDFGWELPAVLIVIWICLLIAGTSNAVNLTDGLDGLATGATVLTAGAFTFIGVWQYSQSCANVVTAGPDCYEVRDPLDLAIIAAALMGACAGFLWWNTSPAKIFMGDTGSLALGGALVALAILTRTELLLVVTGFLFVLITLSVIIQVASFRTTGRRVFKMAPLQHHFELMGWSEVLVVVRFWIIQGIGVAVGLGIFYAGWAAR
ncbi:phospho-N-acetylmuramoyl-pentapeptide-transferase [Allostreptomyces psammosilenae]|nr:phospho-N-acetylmuramoyl-pentapeptide-transferase [Allostreptomyces psammosilenae]